ncbi:redoxin domain-containing protein [Synergistaceae bacterium OttesenSCG-928-D05]|nr:redoxin domain-containing protein [Synergistaceae bacterium OttesenSCG-928-D05]
MTIAIGKEVKHFTLDNQNGQEIKVPCCEGKKILLSFHPLAATGICTKQMQLLDSLHDEFQALGVIPFGVSVDASPAKKMWAESMGLKKLQLLCDFWPHGALADSLGIFDDQEGISLRANILIGEEGKVLWTKVYPMAVVPDFSEIIDFLK